MTWMRLGRALLIAVTVCGLTACGDDAGSANGDAIELPDEVSVVVGAKGGVVKAKGVTLAIPEGALDGDVSITAKATDRSAPAKQEAVSKVYEFGPTGTKFKRDVTVQIVADKPSSGGKSASVYFTKEDEPEVFEQLASTVEGTSVSAKVRHFSMGFAGVDLADSDSELDASVPRDSGTMPGDHAPHDAATDGLDAHVELDAGVRDDASTGQPDAGAIEDAAASPDASATLDATVPGHDAAVGCDPTCPYGLCTGTACAVQKTAGADSSARDLTVVDGGLFWANGYAVFGCVSGSCPTGGSAMAIPGGSHSYAGIVSSRVGATDYVFVTDNQSMQGLWRAELDGDPFSSWSSYPYYGNAGPLAAFGDVVVWGDQNSTYRSSATNSGSVTVMDVGPAQSHANAPGAPRRSVAVDATYVYSATKTDVYKCPVAETCLSTPATAATTALPNVVAMTVYANTLYALGGQPFDTAGEEKIWSVPTSGGAPTLLSTQVPAVASTQQHSYVLLADADALYWNSYDGGIYTCARSACEAQLLVANAGSQALAQDASYLYWIDAAKGAIYRMAKP